MENDLRERIEEIQKIKAKDADICAKIKEEGSSYRKSYFDERQEFEQYATKERRNLERRLAGEKEVFEARQVVKGNEFNNKIKLMRDETVKLREKVDSLGKIVASVRLGDLIEELANLAGISTSEIMAETYSSIIVGEVHTTEEMYEKIKQRGTKGINDFWHLTLCSSSFRYEMWLGADLDSMQADDKTFLEHCTVKLVGSMPRLDASINRTDLIANIPLSYLTGDPDFSWYPADLMTQAVINCVERSKEREVSKKRSRKLSDETNK